MSRDAAKAKWDRDLKDNKVKRDEFQLWDERGEQKGEWAHILATMLQLHVVCKHYKHFRVCA